jgi:hypothetical protein
MPELANRRHEWFARGRASGWRLEDAYECAGYVPDRGHACRLAARPEVASRINELACEMREVVAANKTGVIRELMEIGRESRRAGTPVAYKESRLAFLEAARLHEELAKERARDREILGRELDRAARGPSGDMGHNSAVKVGIAPFGEALREPPAQR